MGQTPQKSNYERPTRETADPDTWKPTRRIQSRLAEPEGPSIEYLAGFFDGEGCFSTCDHRGSVPSFTMMLGTTKEEEPGHFHNRFGGKLYTQTYSNENWRSLYRWHAIPEIQAKIAAETLLPHLIGKKDQCKTFVEALKFKMQNTRNGRPTPPATIRKLQAYSEEIRSHNGGQGNGTTP